MAKGSAPVMVPIHWGTFKLTDEPMDEPMKTGARCVGKAGLDPARLWVCHHGETRAI